MNVLTYLQSGEHPGTLQAVGQSGFDGELEKHKYRLRKPIMEEICEQRTSPAELSRLQKLLGVHMPRGVLTVCMAMKLDDWNEPSPSMQLPHAQTIKLTLMGLVEETLSREGAGGFCSEIGTNRFAVVHYWGHTHSQRQIEELSGSLAFELAATIRQSLKRIVSIGLSDVMASINGLAGAWAEANERLDIAFYSSVGTIVIPPVFRPDTAAQAAQLQSCFDSLYTALVQKERDEADRLQYDIETVARRYRFAPTLLFELYSWLATKLNRASDSQQVVLHLDAAVFSQYVAALKELCDSALTREQTRVWERDEIRKATEFIDRHYAEPIYLQQIARHVNLNPAYLSTLFNREMKMSISEYINRKRVESAMKLLKKRFHSNVELAEAVGIQNERYFCTLFKKYAGISPQKYRSDLKSLSR